MLRSVAVFLTLTTMAIADPTAVITGPKEKKPGSLVILSTKGSIGKSIVYDCYPTSTDWKAVKFLENGGDDSGIIFSTDKEGTYYFVVTAVENNKIARAFHVINIGKPAPIPIPPVPTPDNPLPPSTIPIDSSVLLTAYRADGGPPEVKNALSKIYKSAGNVTAFNKELTQAGQVMDTMRQVVGKPESGVPKDALPNLRRAVADQLAPLFNEDKSAPLNDETRKKYSGILLRVSEILDWIK